MDKLGRKTIQVLGFGMMAVAFLLLAFIPNLEKMTIPFLIDLRVQLLLHGIWAERDDVRVSVGDLSGAGADDGARHRRSDGQAGRIPRGVRLSLSDELEGLDWERSRRRRLPACWAQCSP